MMTPIAPLSTELKQRYNSSGGSGSGGTSCGYSSDSHLTMPGSEQAYLKRISDLELTVLNLRSQLKRAADRESIMSSGKGNIRMGIEIGTASVDDDVELGTYHRIRPLSIKESNCSDSDESHHHHLRGETSFLSTMYERGSWLTFLLIFQSFSSFILVANEQLLATHPDIIFFLTMLVGAGGNAGNQAAVRVIRGLATGSINHRTRFRFLRSEMFMALALCISVGFIGFVRTLLSSRTSSLETVAITVALVSIIFISVVLGAILPFILQYFKFDPAHSSTSIQVVMDILGVLITCAVATVIL